MGEEGFVQRKNEKAWGIPEETKEIKGVKMPEKDLPPMIRVDLGNGRAIYPIFRKNTKGEWELKDKSFQKLITSQYGSKKPAKTDKE